ncbi:hypothetical protein [Nannocystis pusilla]|uniref:hypothetical protein n=1 Tax=Nannocystis pusilla TaxID=889268 RepID=UPI003B77D330
MPEKCVDNNGNGITAARARPRGGRGPGPGHLRDPVPRLWVGYKDINGVAHFARLEGDTGAILDDVQRSGWTTNTFGPYGGAVNSAGDLFVIGYDNEVSIRIDSRARRSASPRASTSTAWASTRTATCGSTASPAPITCTSTTRSPSSGRAWATAATTAAARSAAVDDENRVWGAANGPCRLIELDGDTKTWTNPNITLPDCGSPWGVSIDNEGYVWVVDKANKAYEVDPDTYEIKLVVTGLVNPYTYSDMTGQGPKLVLPQ